MKTLFLARQNWLVSQYETLELLLSAESENPIEILTATNHDADAMGRHRWEIRAYGEGDGGIAVFFDHWEPRECLDRNEIEAIGVMFEALANM
jgi:hypothetical protein